MDALVSVMGDMKRGLMQITIGREFSTRHMAEVSRKYGVPVTWTALLSYLYGPGGHRKQLDLAAEQRKSGAMVIPQVSCRPLNFEFTFAEPFIFDVMKFMNELAVAEAKAPGTRRRAYADPAWREKLRSEVTPLFRNWWDRVVIAWAPSHKELEEQPLTEAAAKLGKDPVDLALDIALASDLQARFRMAVMNFDEKEVAELITDPNTIIALSDAGAHASQLCDACYSTYLLGHWVRERKTFTVEQAVHNLTQRPAEMFGITDRGVLADGRPADVVVFDPKTVGPGPLKRVYDLPAGADRLVSEANGIDAVIVNGKLIRRDGKDTVAANDTLPGRVLRNGRAAYDGELSSSERPNFGGRNHDPRHRHHHHQARQARRNPRATSAPTCRRCTPKRAASSTAPPSMPTAWARSRPSSAPTPSSSSRSGKAWTRSRPTPPRRTWRPTPRRPRSSSPAASSTSCRRLDRRHGDDVADYERDGVVCLRRAVRRALGRAPARGGRARPRLARPQCDQLRRRQQRREILRRHVHVEVRSGLPRRRARRRPPRPSPPR